MLEDPPLLLVKRSFDRAPAELLKKLEGAQTSSPSTPFAPAS